MLSILKNAGTDLLQLFYPNTCAGCGQLIHQKHHAVCINCFLELSATNFQNIDANPVEKIFYGRVPIQTAMAAYFFSKNSPIQNIIHAFKYQSNREAGIQMGKWMGEMLRESNRMHRYDILIPVPIHAKREKKRGYNQASLLTEGVESVTAIPTRNDIIMRADNSESQTQQTRIERWRNVETVFYISDGNVIEGKHILLVDDVITTGATLESCGRKILEYNPASLSIVALAWANG
ncbi:MAG: ComF family protein [Bacteroidota bacterium]